MGRQVLCVVMLIYLGISSLQQQKLAGTESVNPRRRIQQACVLGEATGEEKAVVQIQRCFEQSSIHVRADFLPLAFAALSDSRASTQNQDCRASRSVRDPHARIPDAAASFESPSRISPRLSGQLAQRLA